jgi:Ca2+/Na+ antiporter
MRQPASLREPGNFWKSLWKSPDQFLIEAGAAGETLVARIRLLLTSILLLIPLISLWYEQETWENLVGLAVTLTAFVVSTSGRAAWFSGVLVLAVYLIFAVTLYLLPPKA